VSGTSAGIATRASGNAHQACIAGIKLAIMEPYRMPITA